jgi:hypothetical protein
MRKILIPALLFMLLSAAAAPKEEPRSRTGIVYAEDHAFQVTAPEGWILDAKSGLPHGLGTVFYPEGSSWEESRVVMYISTTLKDKTYGTIEKVIGYDTERFVKGHPGIVIKDSPAVMTGDKKRAVVKHYAGEKFGRFDAVGYLDEKKMVILFAMSARDMETFKGNLKAFSALIGSYRWLADEVRIKK